MGTAEIDNSAKSLTTSNSMRAKVIPVVIPSPIHFQALNQLSSVERQVRTREHEKSQKLID